MFDIYRPCSTLSTCSNYFKTRWKHFTTCAIFKTFAAALSQRCHNMCSIQNLCSSTFTALSQHVQYSTLSQRQNWLNLKLSDNIWSIIFQKNIWQHLKVSETASASESLQNYLTTFDQSFSKKTSDNTWRFLKRPQPRNHYKTSDNIWSIIFQKNIWQHLKVSETASASESLQNIWQHLNNSSKPASVYQSCLIQKKYLRILESLSKKGLCLPIRIASCRGLTIWLLFWTSPACSLPIIIDHTHKHIWETLEIFF